MLPLPFYLIRVLDLTSSVAGACASRFFADLGAQTVLVERAGRPRPAAEGFANLQRNKLSCLLDLGNAQAQAACQRLALACDIIFADANDSHLDAWGLDYATLAGTKPGLIYVSLDAHGDRATGIAAAAGAAAALFHRRGTAAGQRVDVSAIAQDGAAAKVVSFEGALPGEAIGTMEGEIIEVESVPYTFSATPAHVRLPAPRPGQHTLFVLREVAALSQAELDDLRRAGAFG